MLNVSFTYSTWTLFTLSPKLYNIIKKDLEKSKQELGRPIFKRNATSKIGNYRPVSILSGMSKIYKRCNHNSISSYTETILSIFISAYKKSYSSNRVLLRLIEHQKKNLETIKICSYCSYGSLQGFCLIPNDLLAANLRAFV